VIRTILQAGLVATMALVALWAFIGYLQPGFTGEVAEALLRCN
jgi:hypothetical protein